ncbi:MAG: hypothetical protein GY913_23850 [Proteobacteria bacterium]|nr:hypothetical protein [Pseudomonadota bacterium]
MLLFMASAHATQIVDGSSLTLHQALANIGTDSAILIDPSYDASVEGPVIIEKPVSIHSWTAEVPARMPATLVYGAEVVFGDLEFHGETDTFTHDSNGTSYECGGCALWLKESELDASRLTFEGRGGATAPFWIEGSRAYISNLTLQETGAPNSLWIGRGAGGTDVVVQGCTVADNSGPVRIESEVSSDMMVVIDDCEFRDNVSSDPSAAPDIHAENAQLVQIEDSTFSDSVGGTGAGSIYVQDCPTTQLSNLTFKRTSGGDGGAVRLKSDVSSMSPWVNTIDVIGAEAGGKGGAFHIGGEYLDASLSDIRIVDTKATSGGGLYVSDSTVSCSNCGVYGTEATTSGGGLATSGTAQVSLHRTWLCGNWGTTVGSAIFTDGRGSLTAENTIVQDPRGAASGLELTGGTDVAFDHVDLLGRNGTVAIGGEHGDFLMQNTIIAGWGIWADGNVDGTRTIRWNLWDAGTSTNDVQPTSEDIEADPEFVDDFELGDCTSFPMLDALVPSPAIDAGGPSGCLDWDGNSVCDIGAFGGPDGKPDQSPWTEGWDGHPEPEDTGSDETGLDSDDSPVDSPDSDSDSGEPTGDTGVAPPGSTVSYLSGGCRTGAAFLMLLGLGLVVRRR